MRIVLDEKDFRTLVAGGVVEKEESDVSIILSDIGYQALLNLILKSAAGMAAMRMENQRNVLRTSATPSTT